MRLVAVVMLLGAAGCWRSATEPAALSHHSSTAESEWVVTQRGVGPFDASTVATEAALRQLVPRMRVATNDLGGDAGIVFDVFDGPERLAYVVPDDAPYGIDAAPEHRYATSTFAVFVVSPRIKVRGRSWRVGSPFEHLGGIDACECWGPTVTACSQPGSHVHVVFEQPCDEVESAGSVRGVEGPAPETMRGKRIDRIMWKRTLGLDESPQLEPDGSP
jgi:hypothetical protein